MKNNIDKLNNSGNRRIAVIFIGVIAVIYVLIVTSHWDLSYIDFGDGNYLYISSRLADGLVLYQDIMAPQPPLHLYSGCLMIKLGSLFGNPLFTVRAFSLLIHLATMIFIYLIAGKLFGKRFEACAAALLYLMIPVGFWWSQGFQSEGLLILFLVSSFYFYISFTKKNMIWASLLGTAAAFTNMTAAPYLFFNNLYLLVRKKKQFPVYFLIMLGTGIAGVLFMEVMTDGNYLENVFFNQMGTFPNPELSGESVFQYAFGKIVNEGKDILTWEGGYVLFGLAGLVLFILRGKAEKAVREYAGWYSFFSLCSIIYVSKGGTMEYIFTIGEPFAVVFFAYSIGRFWRGPLQSGAVFKKGGLQDTTPFAAGVVILFLIAATFYVGLFYIRNTLAGSNYELGDEKIKQVREIIQSRSDKGDEILSPPYYAFISDRKIVEEYSENYIWTIKYANEVYVNREPGMGVEKALKIAAAIREKKLPIILLDMAQTGKIPPIRQAVENHYRPLKVWDGSHILQTLNPSIGFYVPDHGK